MAFNNKRKLKDEESWFMGAYIQNAVAVAVDHCLNGGKAKSEYIKKPFLQDVKQEHNKELTQEEKEEQRKLLLMQLNVMMANFNSSKKSTEASAET